ncbi:sugar ABC transporter substrate-binding protein [Quadrisphaera setariae]|uniref:Sugar ABC transporter substrate-binding protein n=2 Tax=Quadrisphaera setariae TaxID=2593304 RepID=A0A5C8ZEC2_9ACTN|nr:sugar ABC transporter substrate-binding protein [Quadrisphaera setariae]
MGKGARMRRVLVAAVGVTALATVSACGGGGGTDAAAGEGGDVTLEFSQWWEPELPDGELRGLMDDFESKNPGIKVKLLSGPYASTKEQVTAGAASGTMSDVVGLDGAWVNEFVNQGALADMSKLMADAGYDDSQLASQVKIDGSTYMVPVVNFAYMMFTNDDLLAQAGVTTPPSTRTEFEAAAKAITAGGKASGWILPLALDAPNGVQNDVMAWNWASGGTMLKDGEPDLTNADVTSTIDFVNGLNSAGVLAPGTATLKEQDKVEEFTNGRVGMMIDTLAHINTIKKDSPDLEFTVSAVPAVDGYSGKRGVPYASWGIGVAENSEHQAEAFKLVEYLMSAEANGKLSNAANAFPGNKTAVPDYVAGDPSFKQAFDVWNAGTPANEFVGLPVAESLMRDLGEQLQLELQGKQDTATTLKNAQAAWVEEF